MIVFLKKIWFLNSTDTNRVGKYEGQFLLRNDEGVLILPIREKLFVYVQESFIADDLDFTSLYPSIIKSLNLGIETLVGRIKVPYMSTYEQNHSLEKLKERDPNEEVTIEKLDKVNYTLKSAKIKIKTLVDVIEKNNYTIAASGAIFNTDEQSICSTILQGWFDKREHYRGLKKKAGKAEDWANYKLYDLFQHAFKILQNAMYGTYAKSGWRYTDGHLICSAAITNSGQRLDKESIDFVNKKLNTELNTDSTLKGQFIFLAERSTELIFDNIITDRTIWDVCSFVSFR